MYRTISFSSGLDVDARSKTFVSECCTVVGVIFKARRGPQLLFPLVRNNFIFSCLKQRL